MLQWRGCWFKQKNDMNNQNFPFRKFLEPAYGPMSPEVKILPLQAFDPSNPAPGRAQCSAETFCEITQSIRNCACYTPIMRIGIQHETIPAGDRKISVRIYRPAVKGQQPIALFYHGGSFMMNSLDIYDYVCRYLACFGEFVVIAVDYRLAPEHKFPAGLEDSYAALQWVVKHVSKLGGTKDKISIIGDSSGGNFAAVVSQMARERKDVQIRKQVLIYPVTVIQPPRVTASEQRYGKGHFLEYDSRQNPFSLYLNEDYEKNLPQSSPLYEDNLCDLPPALFIMAECDPLLDQGLMYAARLKDSGVPVEVKIYQGMIHGFINQNYQKTFEALNAVCNYVNADSLQMDGPV